MREKKETVQVWADGFGTWHARVTFPSGYGPRYLDAHIDRIRAKARRAVRAQILERAGLFDKVPPVRIYVEKVDLDALNVMHSITFCEMS